MVMGCQTPCCPIPARPIPTQGRRSNAQPGRCQLRPATAPHPCGVPSCTPAQPCGAVLPATPITPRSGHSTGRGGWRGQARPDSCLLIDAQISAPPPQKRSVPGCWLLSSPCTHPVLAHPSLPCTLWSMEQVNTLPCSAPVPLHHSSLIVS